VNDNANAAPAGCQASQNAGFGGIGVHDLGPDIPDQQNQPNEGIEIQSGAQSPDESV